jgi:uncharacterized repeat protein (TIGR03803 family)
MKTNSCILHCIATLILIHFSANIASATASEIVIHNFSSGSGTGPWSTLVFDSAGNLYGTTQGGGSGGCTGGCGTVFQLTPNGSGGWRYHLLHTFEGQNNADGAYPVFTSGLVFDSVGNLYGTTPQGGISNFGVVFELTPKSNGPWIETIIHSFTSGERDGASPQSGLVFDSSGNLYGTTIAGGLFGMGVIFQLQPKAGGGWKEPTNIIFNFTTTDGSYAPLTFSPAGNAYGVQYSGGNGYGFVFDFFISQGDTWLQRPVFNFLGGLRGGDPISGLLLDASGNLYGTTSGGNATAFDLISGQEGNWSETILHTFSQSGDGDGALPRSGLTQDASGNLYGTTFGGGKYGQGTVYKLVPDGSGRWTENIVYSFTGGADGSGPIGGVVLDQNGRIYGTTFSGGLNNNGVVFEIKQ